MGAGSSASVTAAVKAANEEELKACMNGMDPDMLQKIMLASPRVDSVAPPAAGAPASGKKVTATVEQIFKSIDKDGKGSLTRSEIAAKIMKDDELEALLGMDDVKKLSGAKSAATSWSSLFGDSDEDGDEELTLDEFKKAVAARRMHKIFKEIDSDNSKTISRKEIRDKVKADGELEALLGLDDMAKMSSMTSSATSWESIFGDTDADGDKELSFDEFKKLLLAKQPKQAKTAAEKIFNSIDKDGKGTLSRSEIKAKIMKDGELEALLGMGDLARLSGMKSSSTSWTTLFGDSDVDGDKQLTLDEFNRVIASVRMQKIFAEIDTDNSKTLKRSEIRAKVKADGELEALLGLDDMAKMSSMKSSATSWASIFGDADADGDKELTWEEFEKLLMA